MTPDAISAEWRAEMRALVEAATPGDSRIPAGGPTVRL